MMRWDPIVRIGEPLNVREHRLDAALVTMEVQLTRAPPDEWRAAFAHPPGPSRLIFELELVADRVTFTVDGGEDVGLTLAAIDERVHSANLVMQRAVRI